MLRRPPGLRAGWAATQPADTALLTSPAPLPPGPARPAAARPAAPPPAPTAPAAAQRPRTASPAAASPVRPGFQPTRPFPEFQPTRPLADFQPTRPLTDFQPTRPLAEALPGRAPGPRTAAPAPTSAPSPAPAPGPRRSPGAASAGAPAAAGTAGWQLCGAPGQALVLMPGQMHLGQQVASLRTLLGSCVAITLWHPQRRIGGMCHYLLPKRQRRPGEPADGRYGDEAVEAMVRALQALGTQPADYVAHLYGGADTMSGVSAARFNVGERNIEQGWTLIDQWGFQLDGVDVGEDVPRMVSLTLATGEVAMRRGTGHAPDHLRD